MAAGEAPTARPGPTQRSTQIRQGSAPRTYPAHPSSRARSVRANQCPRARSAHAPSPHHHARTGLRMVVKRAQLASSASPGGSWRFCPVFRGALRMWRVDQLRS